jgi:hypothetical protein
MYNKARKSYIASRIKKVRRRRAPGWAPSAPPALARRRSGCAGTRPWGERAPRARPRPWPRPAPALSALCCRHAGGPAPAAALLRRPPAEPRLAGGKGLPSAAAAASPARQAQGRPQRSGQAAGTGSRSPGAAAAQPAPDRDPNGRAPTPAPPTAPPPRRWQVLKLSEALIKAPDAAQVPALEAMVSEAYKAIDTAVSKGILHANTGARRKARVAHWKRQVRRPAQRRALRARGGCRRGAARWVGPQASVRRGAAGHTRVDAAPSRRRCPHQGCLPCPPVRTPQPPPPQCLTARSRAAPLPPPPCPQVLISAGLYQPAPEQPGYNFYKRVQAKAKAAAAAAN